jgi:hypothetical protein
MRPGFEHVRRIIANRQSPVDRLEEFSFKHVELHHCDAAYFGVEIVGAESIAETFACDCYGGDDESMTG